MYILIAFATGYTLGFLTYSLISYASLKHQHKVETYDVGGPKIITRKRKPKVNDDYKAVLKEQKIIGGFNGESIRRQSVS